MVRRVGLITAGEILLLGVNELIKRRVEQTCTRGEAKLGSCEPLGLDFQAAVSSLGRIANVVDELSAAIVSKPARRALYLLIAACIVEDCRLEI